MNHRLSITKENRGLIVFLLDISLSMNNIVFSEGMHSPRIEISTHAINEMIGEILAQSCREDGVRNYYSIAVIGYSGDAVCSLLTEEGEDIFVPITELDKRKTTTSVKRYVNLLPNGEELIRELHQRCWVKATGSGLTPMHEALWFAHDQIEEYLSRKENAKCTFPSLINITDGGSTDCDMSDVIHICDKLSHLSGKNGELTVMNYHISHSSNASERIIFPRSDMDLTGRDHRFRTLFHSSSDMPKEYNDAICKHLGCEQLPDNVTFKAMLYNVPPAQILSLFNIGSISIKRG